MHEQKPMHPPFQTVFFFFFFIYLFMLFLLSSIDFGSVICFNITTYNIPKDNVNRIIYFFFLSRFSCAHKSPMWIKESIVQCAQSVQLFSNHGKIEKNSFSFLFWNNKQQKKEEEGENKTLLFFLLILFVHRKSDTIISNRRDSMKMEKSKNGE